MILSQQVPVKCFSLASPPGPKRRSALTCKETSAKAKASEKTNEHISSSFHLLLHVSLLKKKKKKKIGLPS